VGVSGSNQTIANGRFWIALKDREDRDVSASQFIDRIRPKLAKIPGIVLYLRAGQDINLSSGPSRAQYQYVLKSNNGALLNTWTQKLTEKLKSISGVPRPVQRPATGRQRHAYGIDRSAAARFGLTTADVDQALYDAFGQRQINEFQTEVNQYKVILELDTSATRQGRKPQLLLPALTADQRNGAAVGAGQGRCAEDGPAVDCHDGMFPAANLSFNLSPGVALGDAVIAARSGQERNRHADRDHRQLPGRGAGVPEFAGQPAVADSGGAGGGVHHSWRAL
jgi:multidrug efflux pump subunit AcrB